MSKYKNKITIVAGIKFHSIKEAGRYLQLKALEEIGEISDLELQPKFPVIVNEKKICNYIADFRYYKKNNNFPTIEDVKGFLTPIYKIKKKLVEALYCIKILET
jgi:hypothetical protein